MDINVLLKEGSNIRSCELKKLLFKYKLKENKCEICGITEWMGKPLVCHLHHIDGNNKNNTLENLQILCPNCHSQTDNYCASWKNKVKNYCKLCGKELKSYNNNYCKDCFHIISRKVHRPTIEELQKDFLELKTYTSIGKKYNVSDRSIRKWCEYYKWFPNKHT